MVEAAQVFHIILRECAASLLAFLILRMMTGDYLGICKSNATSRLLTVGGWLLLMFWLLSVYVIC